MKPSSKHLFLICLFTLTNTVVSQNLDYTGKLPLIFKHLSLILIYFIRLTIILIEKESDSKFVPSKFFCLKRCTFRQIIYCPIQIEIFYCYNPTRQNSILILTKNVSLIPSLGHWNVAFKKYFDLFFSLNVTKRGQKR